MRYIFGMIVLVAALAEIFTFAIDKRSWLVTNFQNGYSMLISHVKVYLQPGQRSGGESVPPESSDDQTVEVCLHYEVVKVGSDCDELSGFEKISCNITIPKTERVCKLWRPFKLH